MPDKRRANCLCCGRHTSVCGPISWSGNCLNCAEALLHENIIGISTKQGYAAKRWARGMRARAESILLDLSPPTS